jgi:hypothetical protein
MISAVGVLIGSVFAVAGSGLASVGLFEIRHAGQRPSGHWVRWWYGILERPRRRVRARADRWGMPRDLDRFRAYLLLAFGFVWVIFGVAFIVGSA